MRHGFYVEVQPVIQKFVLAGVYIYYFCGGRGIGKTYGALDFCRQIGTGEFSFLEFLKSKGVKISSTVEHERFLYLRRTGVEAQSVAAPESCPFKAYNANEGYEICADFNSKLGFGKFFLEDSRETLIGYCAALSTFANLRGVDFSDVTFILYDECIPESKNKHPLKEEGFLFLNMLETINRNRALEGKPEVVVCLLSNPIDLGSPLLSQLNITPIINSMIFKGQDKFTSKERSLHIEKYVDHVVSQEKANSALYKFAQGTGFNERSLSGNFIDNDLSVIKKPNLNEYSAYLSLENLCVYKHKSNGMYHISQIMQPAQYVFRAYEKEKFRTVFYWLYKILVIERKVTYDNYNTKVVFEAMINYKPMA